jgi:hypothetical protein
MSPQNRLPNVIEAILVIGGACVLGILVAILLDWH